MAVYRVHHISWDTEDDNYPGDIDLPEVIEIELSDDLCKEDIEEALADGITDKTGFCHKSFVYEKLNPDYLSPDVDTDENDFKPC